MNRIVFAVLTGTITFFVVGFLFYVVLLGGFYDANLGSAIGVVREVPVPWAIILAQLGFAAMLTYVLIHAKAASAAAGLKVGATFGILFGIGVAFDLYAVTNWSNVNVAMVEPFVTATRMAIAGSAIGWVLGTGRRGTATS